MKQVYFITAAILISSFFFASCLAAAELEKDFSSSLTDPEVEEDESGSIFPWFSEHITIGGTLEVEAWWSKDFDGVSDNHVDLASSEIGIEAELTEWAVGSILIEWDNDKDKFRLDEAAMIFGPTDDFPVYFQFGKFIVPFGVYDGNTVSDPLTKEAFEIKEKAVVVGMDFNDFFTSVYFFDGDANKGEGSNAFEQFGATIGYKVKREAYEFNWNLGYVNSVTSSDTLSNEYDMEAGYAAGFAAQMGLRVAGFVFLTEYVGAIEHYQTLDEDKASARPSTYHLEAGYNTAIFVFPALFTVAYSHSSDLVEIEPKSRLSTVLWLGLIDEIGLTFEYTQDSDYDRDSGGTGEKEHIYTIQLSYEF